MKIVAPAGDMERFLSAIKAGAHEIYMGLKGLGARRNAPNFFLEEFKEAISLAHSHGTRVFLTLNTIIKNGEFDYVYPKLKELYEHGLDAVIVQDLGLAKFIADNFPDIELHGSTQITIANHEEINFLKKLGFKRVVLPRELTFDEIKSIRQKTDIELEVFVSGALCISYSGNCYMSSFIGGRSGNRGLCAQPCRKLYSVSDTDKNAYFISPNDQFLKIEEIKMLKDIGIESIKIEGRMKSPHYVFETVKYYKNSIEEIEIEENSSKIFNRGYGKGYFYGDTKNIINQKFSSNLGELISEIDNKKNGKDIILKTNISLGDGITFVSENYEILEGKSINKIKVKSSKELQKNAKKGDILIIENIPKQTKYIYRNFSKQLSDKINFELKQNSKKIPISAKFTGKIGEFPRLILKGKNLNNKMIECEIKGETILEEALKKATNPQDISEKLLEIGYSNFYFKDNYENKNKNKNKEENIEENKAESIGKDIKIEVDYNVFIPLSEIKNLKRLSIEKLSKELDESYKRVAPSPNFLEVAPHIKSKATNNSNNKGALNISFVVSTEEQKEILLNNKIIDIDLMEIYSKGYDVVPESLMENYNYSDRLASNIFHILKHKENNLMLNWNLNIVNNYAINIFSNLENIEKVIISPEISFNNIKKISSTRLKKAILIYSKIKAMYIESEIFDETKKTIKNMEGDIFSVSKNRYGKTEIYLNKPLNIINNINFLETLNIDEGIIEFSDESVDEILAVLKQLKTKKGPYNPYNYEKGVY